MRIMLGERIKKLRKRDDRTQNNLATALGITNQAVSRWETVIICGICGLCPQMLVVID